MKSILQEHFSKLGQFLDTGSLAWSIPGHLEYWSFTELEKMIRFLRWQDTDIKCWLELKPLSSSRSLILGGQEEAAQHTAQPCWGSPQLCCPSLQTHLLQNHIFPLLQTHPSLPLCSFSHHLWMLYYHITVCNEQKASVPISPGSRVSIQERQSFSASYEECAVHDALAWRKTWLRLQGRKWSSFPWASKVGCQLWQMSARRKDTNLCTAFSTIPFNMQSEPFNMQSEVLWGG